MSGGHYGRSNKVLDHTRLPSRGRAHRLRLRTYRRIGLHAVCYFPVTSSWPRSRKSSDSVLFSGFAYRATQTIYTENFPTRYRASSG